MTVYLEAQYDSRRREMLLQASAGFGDPQPYRVTVKDVSREEGMTQARLFWQMYRDLGVRVSS